jgi:hypothetical protein
LGRRSDFESGDMKRVLALIGLVALAPAVAQAASPLTFYPTRDALNAAYPGLSLQTFTSAELYDEPFVTEANPLDRKTNDAVFKKGSILPGLTIRTLKPGLASNALLVYGGGPVGTISVGNYWFGDTLELSFPLGVQAVGENAIRHTVRASRAGSARSFSMARPISAARRSPRPRAPISSSARRRARFPSRASGSAGNPTATPTPM